MRLKHALGAVKFLRESGFGSVGQNETGTKLRDSVVGRAQYDAYGRAK